MLKTICAGLVYFALVLGTGFVLGVFQVLFVVSRIGERWAELSEMPIMAAAIFFQSWEKSKTRAGLSPDPRFDEFGVRRIW